MYLLPKLIVLQLLLLCVATRAESPWEFIPKGGIFYRPRHYAVEENTALEIDITYVGNANTVMNFDFPGNSTYHTETRNMKPPTQLQLEQLDKKFKEMKKAMPHGINIITTTLKYTPNRNTGQVKMLLTQDEYYDVNDAVLKTILFKRLKVQYIDGPTISLEGENVELVDDKGDYDFMEKEQFSLKCYAGGLVNTTIEWVDSAGNTVISSQETELGPLTKMDDTKMEFFRFSQILKVSAQREVTSFGCRMKAPSYYSLPYEDTKWFNFRVVRDDTTNSNCDPTNPDCLNVADGPVGVRSSLKFS